MRDYSELLLEVQHRPWPLPDGPWRWRQSWHDLLFAHWPIPAPLLAPHIPQPLSLQEYNASAWIGVVPFSMHGVMRRPFPDLPWISSFPEINLRTYVEHGGRPGVWFLSLDASNPLAVWAARRFFCLPYHLARIRLEGTAAGVRYHAVRRSDPKVEFEAEYEPTSPVFLAPQGSLEHWLTERYCLYSQSSSGELYRTEIHHRPWPLQQAEVSLVQNRLSAPYQIDLPGPPMLAHYAQRLEVVVWPPTRLD